MVSLPAESALLDGKNNAGCSVFCVPQNKPDICLITYSPSVSQCKSAHSIEIHLVPPVFNDSLTQLRLPVLINTTVTLLCSAYGYPKPSIRWTRNVNPQRNEELIIDRVQVTHFRSLKKIIIVLIPLDQ